MVLHKYIKHLLALCSLLLLTACDMAGNAEIPNIELTTIKGETLQTTQPQVTLVSFWATSCKSCVEEMPDLIKTYEQYHQQGFEILAVSMEYDPPAQLLAYTEQHALPFPVIHDSYGDIAQKFGGVHVTPTAYLYDKTGKRINKTLGILDFEALRKTLQQELS